MAVITLLIQKYISFLSAFTKFRKAIISLVTSVYHSVRPSVRTEQLGFDYTDSHKNCLSIFQKLVKKNHVLVKPDKNNG